MLRWLSGNRVRIGRMIFDHEGWYEWVGNWCWDEIRIVNVNRLLRMLKAKGATCSCGPEKFYRKFNRRTNARAGE